MNKRVTIITWLGNTTLNYGGALQATAMQGLLRTEDCRPTTIDFMYLGKNRKEILSALLSRGMGYLKTYYMFQNWYQKYVNLSPKCYYDDDIVEYAKENSDILLCGSDCIWSETYASQRFFWDYRELDSLPHIAYAPGVDIGDITYDMSRVIDKFVAISGREEKVGELLGKYNVPVETVLDPTLTVSERFWEKKAAKRLVEEDYVVCYMLSRMEYHQVSIDKIKKKYGVRRVVYINTDFIDKPCNEVYSDYNGNVLRRAVGPAEFLSLMKYADAVCTDSFHGMCVSIIFQRDFYIFSLKRIYKKSDDPRFASLLPRLELTKRYVDQNSDIDTMEEIDWNRVEERLYRERKHSRRFLRDAIAKAEEWRQVREGQ